MERKFMAVALLLLLLVPAVSVSSQSPPSCPQIVTLALESTNQLCDHMGSNEACYGHIDIEVAPRVGIEDFVFESQGDIAALEDIQVFRLSSMDPDAGTWGVALLNVKSYTKYAEPQDMTFLLFGDVAIEDATEAFTSIEMTVAVRSYINARLDPNPDAGVLAVLAPGQTVEARARTADSTWVMVMLPETGRMGWVFATLLQSDESIESLAVVNESGTYYGPMQAFTVQTGVNDAPCPESPDSGLMVQTPEGVAEVTLLVNEVIIDMQATVFLQAQPAKDFSIMVVDGWAEVEVNGQRQPVFAGSQVTIPLSETGTASGVPSPPEPYDLASLQTLPVSALSSPVEISEPLTEEAIAERISQWEGTQTALYDPSTADSSSTEGTDSATQDGTQTNSTTSSSGDEGDSGRTPPGHGGVPPGQEKKE